MRCHRLLLAPTVHCVQLSMMAKPSLLENMGGRYLSLDRYFSADASFQREN